MKQYIMLSPVNYAENNQVDLDLLTRQWSNLRNVLVTTGNDIITISTTTKVNHANASEMGLIYKHMFVPSKLKTASRPLEEEFFQEWFANHQYSIKTTNVEYKFMGAADAVFNRDKTILWYGISTSGSSYDYKAALDVIFEDTRAIVRGLELCDGRFKTLNSCFCPLGKGELLWYPPAFTWHSQGIIESWYAGKNIKVKEADALAMACSAITQQYTIVMPRVSEELLEELNEYTYLAVTVDLSEFTKMGMGCKSLALEVVE